MSEKTVDVAVQSWLEERLREEHAELLDRSRAVRDALHALDLGPEILAVGMLDTTWDALEMETKAVARRFGSEVARLLAECRRLAEVSEVHSQLEEGDEAQTEKLRQMVLAMVGDARVVVIKLAQQLRYLHEIKQAPEGQRRQAAINTRRIYAPLANRLGIGQIKWELEDFAFRYLEPEAYRRIARALDGRRAEREAYIEQSIVQLRKALDEAGIEALIQGRAKHIYSIFKKMQAKHLGFDELFDVRALRIQVEDIAGCYAALGVVHSLWAPIPKEFDDYIAYPKPNYYRSLHTAVIGPERKALEVQIRTHDMHRFAEFGVAAHWRYKEGGKSDAAQDAKIAWLRRLLDPTPDDQDDDPLEQLRSEAIEERVFVFTPAGRVIDLPQGATPLDFAYAVHTQVGHRCRGAKVNGRIVPLTYTLSTGEQVEILTAREPNPSRDWLSPHTRMLKTGSARAKIRNWFNRQDREKLIASGRTVIERELRRLGVQDADFTTMASRLGCADSDALFADVGRGNITPAQIADAVRAPLGDTTSRAQRRPGSRRAGGKSDAGNAICVSGVGNLMTQMARCCKPVQGDAIVGYITQGRGVTIHRADCPNMLNLDDEQAKRRIEVDWDDGREGADAVFTVDIAVEAVDRTGLLRDVTTALSNEDVNIVAIDTRSDKSNHEAKMRISMEVASLAQLSRAMDRVEQLPNIFDVRRLGEG